MKLAFVVAILLFSNILVKAQSTFPVNGIADVRTAAYLFVNATIVIGNGKAILNGQILIKDGQILHVGNGVANKIVVPKDVLTIDCAGKFIYPSFIDLYTDYGITKSSETKKESDFPRAWNPAMHSEQNAINFFATQEDKAKAMRNLGFGVVLSHVRDGISRGTGLLTTLANGNSNKVVLKDRASAHFSFNKGSSKYDYPNSLMGSVALLRQNFLDAKWYKGNSKEGFKKEGLNLGLHSFNDNLSLPQIFETNDKWNLLRADKIGDEFGVSYILKGGTDEYQRINEIKNMNAVLIQPINWPNAMDVEDPLDTRFVSVADLKHWEMAPTNLAALAKANIKFAITTDDLKDKSSFYSQLRKSIQAGLSDSLALAALTTIPASVLQMDKKLGTLEMGKLANFIITSGPVFDEKTIIYQNWINGERYDVRNENWQDLRGTYKMNVGNRNYNLLYHGTVDKPKFILIQNSDTAQVDWKNTGQFLKINYVFKKDSLQSGTLSGAKIKNDFYAGKGILQNGQVVDWQVEKMDHNFPPDTIKVKKDSLKLVSTLSFPNGAFGKKSLELAYPILIKNATVWTNEEDGILLNMDVFIEQGKIKKIGKFLSAALGTKVIDGTGKHLTAGIIDEHSHIAISGGVNECSQSVTAEVRVGDVLNPDDINIYRQLSGGVTSSHLLHGSCNTIGGQTQLIKLRWGANADEMKFANWEPQIKFALGENVKKSSNGNGNTRYPDTRMGVYQVLMDGFSRASDYQKLGKDKRIDLELEALSAILNKKMFITCHSYVQSEINGLIKVADSFDFTVNTFTHILEGYKVADKMKAHGANASTFSDWWAYKMEVQDAIPYNAFLMQQVGLNVAINSDDAEMARRLNQEAAKSMKYGGMKEQEALKMVTLNPAKMLHIDAKVGSIKEGKDADLVLWTDYPLSIYAKSLYTIVDGIIYFDRAEDEVLQKELKEMRTALIKKMLKAKKGGAPSSGPKAPIQQEDFCEDDHHPR
jgi:imidazolonepropionase-like amidohydrolase